MGEVALRYVQGALEVSKGSNVAATRILAAKVTGTNFNLNRQYVDEDRGSFAMNYRFTTGAEDNSFTLESEAASYEQLGWFLQTAVKGSVAPVGGTVTFTPSTSGVTGDDLQAASIEFGDDTQGYLLRYCEANTFSLDTGTIAVGASIPLKFSGEYMASSFTSNTKTPGLSYPTLTTIDVADSTFYIGPTGTAFGSLSPLAGSLRAFKLTYNNNLAKKLFVGDGRTPSAMGRGKRTITFEATVEGNADGVSRFNEWKLGTTKRMRLKFATGAKSLTIDGRISFMSFEIGDVDTNTVYNLAGEFEYDSDLTAEIQFVLANGESSYT